MQVRSPLFISAIELITHSTELLRLNNEKKYKFIVLHLANAIELILKDRLIVAGKTIYKPKTSQTLGVWECMEELSNLNIPIPERPVLELLIDDRNSIQHRFGFPNKEIIYYYLSNVINFFKRFLKDEYTIDLNDELSVYLDIGQLEFLGLTGSEVLQLDNLKNFSIELAVLHAFEYLQSEFITLSKRGHDTSTSKYITPKSHFLEMFLEILVKNDFANNVDNRQILNLREVRNQIAHSRANISQKDTKQKIEDAYKAGLELVKGLDRAKREGFFDTFDWDTLF